MSCPVRVLLDARMLIGKYSGIARVVTETANALARQNEIKVLLLCGNVEPPKEIVETGVCIIPSSFSRSDRSPIRRWIWEERNLPRIIRESGADLFHATWNSGIPRRCPVPALLTLHDLIPWHDPASRFRPAHQQWAYKFAVRSSCQRAALVTTVSAYTGQQLIDTLDIDPGKVVVVHNGARISQGLLATEVEPHSAGPCGTGFQPVHDACKDKHLMNESSPNPPPYVLYVGGHEARKNVAGVFEAIRCMSHLHPPGVNLRLTGTLKDLTGAARDAFERLPEKQRVEFLGTPSDTELDAHYRSALCLLMLSTAEGFGLPVLEAMARGCPVIAARAAALPEIVGDAGWLVDPHDPRESAEAIHQLATDARRRQRLADAGRRRVVGFEWHSVAEQVRGVYEAVLAGTPLAVKPSMLAFNS